MLLPPPQQDRGIDRRGAGWLAGAARGPGLASNKANAFYRWGWQSCTARVGGAQDPGSRKVQRAASAPPLRAGAGWEPTADSRSPRRSGSAVLQLWQWRRPSTSRRAGSLAAALCAGPPRGSCARWLRPPRAPEPGGAPPVAGCTQEAPTRQRSSEAYTRCTRVAPAHAARASSCPGRCAAARAAALATRQARAPAPRLRACCCCCCCSHPAALPPRRRRACSAAGPAFLALPDCSGHSAAPLLVLLGLLRGALGPDADHARVHALDAQLGVRGRGLRGAAGVRGGR
jgi:hypothetical protein